METLQRPINPYLEILNPKCPQCPTRPQSVLLESTATGLRHFDSGSLSEDSIFCLGLQLLWEFKVTVSGLGAIGASSPSLSTFCWMVDSSYAHMSLPQQLTMEGGACQITGNSHTIAFHALRPWPSVSAGPPVSASRLGAKDSNVPQLLHNKEEKFMALWHQDFELCRSRSLAMDTVRHNKRSLINGFAVGRPAIHACVHLKSMSIRCLGTLFLTAAKPQQCRNRKCYTMVMEPESQPHFPTPHRPKAPP